MISIISPVYNREDTLEKFLFKGDTDIVPIQTIIKQGNELDHIFLINDASTDKTPDIISNAEMTSPWIGYIRKEKNEGVARALLDGYKRAIINGKRWEEQIVTLPIIVRLDSDLEHNPKHIPELVEKINSGFDGALHQLQYRKEDQTELDYWFDGSQGVFQGNVILGKDKKLLHNCPGYCAYRMDVMEKILPYYAKYLAIYKKEYGIEPSWGGDMVILFIAKLLGYNIATDLVAPSTRPSPGRSITKVLNQISRNTFHLQLMEKIKEGKVKLL